MSSPSIHHFQTDHDFLEASSKSVMETITDMLSRQETCRIGLAGGSTPKELYRQLSQRHIPWDRITIILIDERFVPASDKQSNYGMIRDTLISNINIPFDQVVYFDTSLGYESAILAMEQKLIQLTCSRQPLFDLLILGAGPDGHIARIFQDSLDWLQEGYLTAKTSTDVFPVHDRLTCTMEALTNCQQAILLLKGHEKAHLIDQLESGDDSTPVGRFIKKIPTIVFAAH
jgi:6-phosphogluconolactonase